jgi:exopolyphosphatase / guanosine-5'-triphosphate,3'-diphosphate pyrophosphatase
LPLYAAIDIGSNSIRMEAADVVPGQAPRILASDREVTRLGESVFRNGSVSEEAMRDSCAVLTRMAALYRKLEVAGVRAVATSAIRDSHNQREFLARASEAAGTRVELISGREEARLIHLGVESSWPQDGKRVLILDIGGGSAEIISAVEGRQRLAFSRPLGAVRLKEMFLGHDPSPARELRAMEEYIDEKLAGPVRQLGRDSWDRAIATSATAAAVASAVARAPRSKREEIDRFRVAAVEVRKLYAKISTQPLAGRRKVTGIGPRRAEIIVPGLAVLAAFLREFRLPAIFYSRAGVRDGIIADLAARSVGAELSRLAAEQRTEVESMCRRYGVSLPHARKVADLAHHLFTGLEPLHRLPPPAGKLIEAAAYLHDVGHFVSGTGHHKHSYYVVSNSDMPGFTDRERLQIAALCRYHRKALPSPLHHAYQALTAEEKRALNLSIPILRLADNLDRSHDQRVESVDCQVRNGEVVLEVHSQDDLGLEEWGAERTAEVFRQIYGRKILLVRGTEED